MLGTTANQRWLEHQLVCWDLLNRLTLSDPQSFASTFHQSHSKSPPKSSTLYISHLPGPEQGSLSFVIRYSRFTIVYGFWRGLQFNDLFCWYIYLLTGVGKYKRRRFSDFFSVLLYYDCMRTDKPSVMHVFLCRGRVTYIICLEHNGVSYVNIPFPQLIYHEDTSGTFFLSFLPFLSFLSSFFSSYFLSADNCDKNHLRSEQVSRYLAYGGFWDSFQFVCNCTTRSMRNRVFNRTFRWDYYVLLISRSVWFFLSLFLFFFWSA